MQIAPPHSRRLLLLTLLLTVVACNFVFGFDEVVGEVAFKASLLAL
ncbi:hypothetical protein K9N08_03180 [Candidatus Gracilibacteria bacterium]|nr:hypothetical protein [Candidatus Gracilibacteria bacterium]MCF7856533.1 hypothetical protein [Candidatus Gracilibacteria bacterium]MCF7896856.1 hypothetical protein [Candidatus Gracilibacteria bacterium]